MLKEVQKKARLKLTEAGLKFLLANRDVAISRSEFFTGKMPLPGKERGVFIKEASNKSWQTPVLERLIQAQMIVKTQEGSEILYAAGDASITSNVLNDHVNNGLILSHFIFPNEVPPPKAAEITLPITGLAAVEKEQEVEIPAHTFLRQKQEAQEQVSIDASDLLNRLLRATLSLHEDNVSTLDRIASTSKALLNALDAMSNCVSNLEKRVNGLANEIERLDESNKSLKNVVDANQSVSKKISYSLEKVDGMSESIKEFVVSVVESGQESKGLCVSVNKLVSEIKAKEENKLSMLAEKLSQVAEDAKGLSSLALDAISERSSSNES